MKNVLFVCGGVLIISEIICAVISVANSERIAMTVRRIASAFVLFIMLNSIKGCKGPDLKLPDYTGASDYSNFSEDTLEKIYSESHKEIERRIADDVDKRFGTEDTVCEVDFDKENIKINSVRIIFSKGTVLSEYEVRRYIYDTLLCKEVVIYYNDS